MSLYCVHQRCTATWIGYPGVISGDISCAISVTNISRGLIYATLDDIKDGIYSDAVSVTDCRRLLLLAWVDVINLNLCELEIIVGWSPGAVLHGWAITRQGRPTAGAPGLCLAARLGAGGHLGRRRRRETTKVTRVAAINNKDDRELFVCRSVVTSELVAPTISNFNTQRCFRSEN